MNDHYEIRGLAALLQFRGLHFFPDEGGDGGGGAAGAGGGDGAGSGAAGGAGGAGGDGAGAGGAAGAGGGGDAGAGGGGGAAAASAAGDNVAELRRNYESAKTNLEKWTKLGADPDQVAQHATAGQKLYTQYEGIATRLGYKKEEFQEAYNADPGKVIAFLGRKAAERQAAEAANGNKPLTRDEINRLLEDKLNEKTAPLEERENLRLANEADFKVSQTFEKLGQTTFTPEGWKAMPQGERDTLQLVMQEMLAYDEPALIEIKTKGATAPVQKYFQEAVKFLDTYYNARLSRETGGGAARAAGAGAGANGGGGKGKGGGAATPPGVNAATGKPWTINELIEDPSRIGAAYK
jgi:hypothetical protein